MKTSRSMESNGKAVNYQHLNPRFSTQLVSGRAIASRNEELTSLSAHQSMSRVMVHPGEPVIVMAPANCGKSDATIQFALDIAKKTNKYCSTLTKSEL